MDSAKKEQAEQARLRKAKQRAKKKTAVAEVQKEQKKKIKKVEREKDYFSLTEDGLDTLLVDAKKAFSGIQQNPSLAVLLFYLNSGYYRFDQHKDYSKSTHEKDINVERIISEIDAEVLTEEETSEKLKSFFSCHSTLDCKLMSCGSCGLRMFERPRDPIISYERVPLSSPLMVPLLLDENGMKKLNLQKKEWGEKRIVIDSHGTTARKDLWKIRSLFYTGNGKYFHLHPELVDGRKGEEHTHLCKKCYGDLVKGNIPKLSVASGLDFGIGKRLGLAETNLHEQIIISRCRLFHATMKVSFGKGKRMACHAILFSHDAPDIAAELLSSQEMFDPERLCNTISIVLVDSKGQSDHHFRKLYGSNIVFARPWVIFQWLVVLQAINPRYHDLKIPEYSAIQWSINQAN
jgi:DNA polymerase III delta prime subunit